MSTMQTNGLEFNEELQCLDVTFNTNINSPILYDYMNALYTVQDVESQKINNENFYGNEIESNFSNTSLTGSNLLTVLQKRLRGSSQINELRSIISTTVLKFQQRLKLQNITFNTNYSTGQLSYKIDLIDLVTQTNILLEF